MGGAVARHHLGATALHHLLASLVDIGAGDTLGAANHDAVGASGALAAAVEGDPEEVVSVAVDDNRGLDGAAISRAGSEGVKVGAHTLAGAWVDADHLDAGPEGAKRHPYTALGVGNDVGVDGVLIGVFEGLDDEALVGPGARGAGGRRGVEDSGPRGAEARGAVVEVVEAVAVGQVGRPEVLLAFSIGCSPGRAVREGRAGVALAGAVGGRLKTDVIGGKGGEVTSARGLNNSRVVDEGVTADRAGGDVLTGQEGSWEGRPQRPLFEIGNYIRSIEA